jgi:translation elongation factor P/translation initiation factor 5A
MIVKKKWTICIILQILNISFFFLAKGTNIYKIKVKDTETGGTLKPDPAKTKRNTS